MPISVSLFSEGHSPWCSTGFGTVDSVNSSGAVLVSTRLAQSKAQRSWWLVSEHTNRNHSTQRGGRRQERICVGALQKCHIPTESMFKERRKTGLFIFHSTNSHAFFRFYDAILMTFFFYRLGNTFAVNQHDHQYFVKTHQKTFISFCSFILCYSSTKNPAHIWPG